MLTRFRDSVLQAFARWFASAAGVWQTFILTVIWTAIELIHPAMDPSFLKFMAVLTIYSAVTQPALAYVGWQAGLRTDKLLNEELSLIKEELRLVRGIAKHEGVE